MEDVTMIRHQFQQAHEQPWRRKSRHPEFGPGPLFPAYISEAYKSAVAASLQRGLLVVLVSLAASGCATLRGQPETYLDVNISHTTNTNATSLLNARTAAKRNIYLFSTLADIDILYLRFRREFLGSDRHFNAGLDLGGLAADIAGRSVESVAAKDNFFLLSALLTGTRATVNSRYFYAQTGIALVRGMDAARAEMELGIRQKLQFPIDQYTSRDAFADAIRYFNAGTLTGGLDWLQREAQKQEIAIKEETLNLPLPSEAELNAAESLRDSFEELLKNPERLCSLESSWNLSVQNKAVDERRLQARREFVDRRSRDGATNLMLQLLNLKECNQ